MYEVFSIISELEIELLRDGGEGGRDAREWER